ncbi:MAG: pyruvate kinase [Fibrobacteres bacterium]|nr:pyruvate kinase [Fibrobacterota bacterium]
MRRTKIIATIGPASENPVMIEKLIKSGVNVFRFNFSHGTHEDHLRRLKNVRKLSDKLAMPVAVIQDLQGPKIRCGSFDSGFTILRKGATFTITTRPIKGNDSEVSTTYLGLPKDVKPGELIYLNDGLLRLQVEKVKGSDVITKVIVGGKLSDHKGINLPGTKVSAPSLTPKDLDDLKFGLAHGFDFVALSFVRTPEDIRRVKKIVKAAGKNTPVVAKIEKPEAICNLEEIVSETDAIMVARGDLGVELSPEAVPAIQKKLIRIAIDAGKPVITATQMLESMTQNPFPTRAEASDVANAVFDGTDAVMLSAETASGQYPLECVAMMDKIIRAAESGGLHHHEAYLTDENDDTPELALTGAALYACEEICGKAIIVHSRSGNTAKRLSRRRRDIDLIALSPDPAVVRNLSIYWGIRATVQKYIPNTDKLIDEGIKRAVAIGAVKSGDGVIVLAGTAFHTGSTNLLKIAYVR